MSNIHVISCLFVFPPAVHLVYIYQSLNNLNKMYICMLLLIMRLIRAE